MLLVLSLPTARRPPIFVEEMVWAPLLKRSHVGVDKRKDTVSLSTGGDRCRPEEIVVDRRRSLSTGGDRCVLGPVAVVLTGEAEVPQNLKFYLSVKILFSTR